jgi:hypothetical protein
MERHAYRSKASLATLLVALVACMAGIDEARPAAIATTPPMGWNSWDAYGFTIDEAGFKANATVLATFASLGWQYAIIDEGWYMKDPFGKDLQGRDYQLDAHGRLVPAVERFPSARAAGGLRPLADWTHRHGLKFGIHIVRGIPKAAARSGQLIDGSQLALADAADTTETCPWDDGNFGVRDNAAGQAYYDSVFRLYAAWHVDFVKVDCIANNPWRPTEIRQIADAIAHSGRPMVLSLSPGPTGIAHADEVGRQAQMWRISNDIWDGWSFAHDKPGEDFPSGVVTAFDNLALWSPHARAGHWPDADMLPIGTLAPHPGWGEPRDTRLSHDEQQTQFVLWSIAHSPLILGCNLTRLDPFTRSLLRNRALIDLDQGGWDSRPVSALPAGMADARAWVATRTRGHGEERVVALFNLGQAEASWHVDWRALGVAPPRSELVDLLTGRHVKAGSELALQVPAHGTVVYRLQ